MNAMGQQAKEQGRGGEAAGYFGRAADIDGALADQSPAYAAARDNYSAASRKIEALKTGQGLLGAPGDHPSDFVRGIAAMSPDEQAMAAHGARSAIVDRLGNRQGDALGLMREMSRGENMGQNISALFGKDAAASYQGAMGHEIQKVNDANFISPNTGSQTQLRGGDAAHVGHLNSLAPHNLAAMAIKHLFGEGRTMTEGERAAIVNLGLSDPASALKTLGPRFEPSAIPGPKPALPWWLYSTDAEQQGRAGLTPLSAR